LKNGLDHTPLPPSPGRHGWPWDDDAGLPIGDEANLPAITVVTPNRNSGAFIEETIRSVLLQRYPRLEYFVIDGASTDGSVEIIRRYAPHLTQWASESDRGQSDAINKGWSRSHGEILAWLNSDDRYEPGTLQYVGAFFAAHPEVDWICGACRLFDAVDVVTRPELPPVLQWLVHYSPWGSYRFPQPSVFIRRRLLDRFLPLDASLHYCMDFDLYLRMRLAGHEPVLVDRTLSAFRVHAAGKTTASMQRFFDDYLRVIDKVQTRLGWSQRLVVSFVVRYVREQRAFFEAATPWPRLVAGPLACPTLLLNRMYWGAWKRAATAVLRGA
jgi:glycosyltransferase involved in cell wall biosynthesis